MHHINCGTISPCKSKKNIWYLSIVFSVFFPLLQFKYDYILVLDTSLKDALAGLVSLVELYAAFIKLNVSSDGAATFPVFGGSTLPRDSILILNIYKQKLYHLGC